MGVLGRRTDVGYLQENRKIFEEMTQRGAVITEFPMGIPELPNSEPDHCRNGFLVVEGARPGSLVTAGLAMEFGRQVYGHATQPSRFGPNQLIKQGTKLVTSWEDVIEELPTPVRSQLLPVEAVNSQQRAKLWHKSLAPGERTLYNLLTYNESRHTDDMVEISGPTSSEALAALFDLELEGVVRQLPGKQFLKVLL